MSEELIQGDLQVMDGTAGKLVPAPSTTLFRTDDPAEVLRRATDTANALMPVIQSKGLVVKVQGKDYLTVSAWLTLGAMVGCTPVCVWTRKLDNGWEARVEARTLDGRVIGAAEAECLTDETRWGKADDYAVRSMAQTRATSKSLSSVLRFVATLGGAEGTPAEEMPAGGFDNRPDDGPASDKQRKYVSTLFKGKGISDSDQAAIVKSICGEKLTKSGASQIIEDLKEGRTAELLQKAGLGSDSATPEAPADDEGLSSGLDAEDEKIAGGSL